MLVCMRRPTPPSLPPGHPSESGGPGDRQQRDYRPGDATPIGERMPDGTPGRGRLRGSRALRNQDPTGTRRPRRRVRTAIAVVAGVVSVALVVTGGYAWFSYQNFVSGVTHIDAITGADRPAVDVDGKAQNILLVGDDHRPANATAEQLVKLGTTQDGGGLNTDTMMVLHLPADGSRATLVSFPRDSWVSIPGHGKNKLNSAFRSGTFDGGGDAGGAQLLIATIQNLTGLTIDHFVRVSMLGFYNIAEALGPIDVCLNAAVKDPYSTLDLPAGVSTLNAQQALAFVRQRHGLARGDLDREVRQQYFLSVESRRILSAGTLLNPGKLNAVLNAVSASLQTDPDLNFIAIATQFRGLSANDITFATVPITGTPTIRVGSGSVSVVQIDTAAMPEFIGGITGTPTKYGAATASAVGGVTVRVQNGSGIRGFAAENTAALKDAGFRTGAAATVSTQPTTTIEYPLGMEADAKALSAYVAGASVVASTDVTGVTLVLGGDGKRVATPVVANPGPTGSPQAPSAAPPAPAPSAPAARGFAEGTCIN